MSKSTDRSSIKVTSIYTCRTVGWLREILTCHLFSTVGDDFVVISATVDIFVNFPPFCSPPTFLISLLPSPCSYIHYQPGLSWQNLLFPKLFQSCTSSCTSTLQSVVSQSLKHFTCSSSHRGPHCRWTRTPFVFDCEKEMSIRHWLQKSDRSCCSPSCKYKCSFPTVPYNISDWGTCGHKRLRTW